MELVMTQTQALLLVALLDGKIAATHNHIASAVEAGPDTTVWVGTSSPTSLVKTLRAHEDLRAFLNRNIREDMQ